MLAGSGKKRPAGHGGRCFAAGIRVEPELHYFVKPEVGSLFDGLKRGKFCLLTGHRQSGKSTSVSYAASRLLEETGYLPVTLWRGLPDAKREWSTADMWLRLCKLLHLACPEHFPPVERGRPYDCDDFVEAFNATHLKVPVVLIIDEADTLLKRKQECLDEFLHNVRFLKSTQRSGGGRGPTYKLWTMLLVGTDRVKDLEAAKQPGYEPPGHLSPFPHDHAFSAVRFSLEDIDALLQQFADEVQESQLGVREIAESIFQLMAGHTGLTGTCLAFMDQEAAYTLKTWDNLAVTGRLAAHVFSLATYTRVMQAARESGSRKLQQQLKKFVEQVSVRYHLEDFDEEPVRDYIANGVLILEQAAPYCYLKLSSPLLRMAILPSETSASKSSLQGIRCERKTTEFGCLHPSSNF